MLTSNAGVKLYDVKISDVSSTLLLTLYCQAIESLSKDPILNDPKAVGFTRELNKEMISSKDRLQQRLASGRIKNSLVVHIAMRAKKYDKYVREFLATHPDGVVVNMGCGLDTRFWRIDNGSVHYYDLDLPEVIDIKKRLFQESERYRFIASSVLDHGWMKALVCEVVNARWARKPLSDIVAIKMRKELLLGSGVRYISGLRKSDEMESWDGCACSGISGYSGIYSIPSITGWVDLS